MLGSRVGGEPAGVLHDLLEKLGDRGSGATETGAHLDLTGPGDGHLAEGGLGESRPQRCVPCGGRLQQLLCHEHGLCRREHRYRQQPGQGHGSRRLDRLRRAAR